MAKQKGKESMLLSYNNINRKRPFKKIILFPCIPKWSMHFPKVSWLFFCITEIFGIGYL